MLATPNNTLRFFDGTFFKRFAEPYNILHWVFPLPWSKQTAKGMIVD